jgi:hypothetical protein
MTVTMNATMKVQLPAFRAALVSVLPHAKRTKKDEDLVLHRIRLVYANGSVFVTATNGSTTGLDKVSYIADGDTRGTLWEPDDGPMIVDLWPEQVRLLKQWITTKAVGDDDDMVVSAAVDLKTHEVEFETIGTTNAGERWSVPLQDPHTGFPDVVDITVRALTAAAGESLPARSLVQDGKLIGLFNAASVQHHAPLRWRATGTRDNANGFVVECGPSFVGTISSDPGGEEGVRRHSRWSQDMIAGLSTDFTGAGGELAEQAGGKTLASV